MPSKSKAESTKVSAAGNRLLSVLAYAMITAPMILLTEKKDEFARFHAKQGLGFLIIYALLLVLINLLWWVAVLGLFINFGIALLLSYLAVMAAQGKKVVIPVAYDLGEQLVKIFKQ